MKPTFFRIFFFSLCFSLLSLTGWSREFRIDGIQITGNKITKDFIILRELPFATGDIIPEENLAEQLRLAKENLNNLLLFNFVEISSWIY